MTKWKKVSVKQELVDQVNKEEKKTSEFKDLSQFVSEAVQLRLETLAQKRDIEYLERYQTIRTPQFQAQLFYTPRHVWAKMTSVGAVELGVTDYFESRLKGIVYVGNFKEGDKVSKDEPFGTIETVVNWPTNVIHDLYSPIDGKIVQVNKKVLDDPYILNGNPYQWIAKLQPKDSQFHKELDKILSFDDYKKLIEKPRVFG